LITFLVILGAALSLIEVNTPTSKDEGTRPQVAVSTFALFDMVRHIGGDVIDSFMIIPFGVDVHSFEPTPRDLARLSKSSLFVFSGAGLEPWATTFSKNIDSLDVSKSVKLMPIVEEDASHESEHDHHHEGFDPHYWLDMQNMIMASKIVEKELADLSPAQASDIHQNAQQYRQRLERIDERFRKGLSRCKKHEIVVNHKAFGYLAHRYGFKVIALTGLSPEAMPSAKTMATVIDTVKSKQINTLFFESFVSDRLISTIARETGAGVEVLHPLANITADEAAREADFESLMQEDLEKLSHAMECQ